MNLKSLTPHERVEIARHIERPTAKDYIDHMIDDFIYLAGDRNKGEDASIVGGIGFFRDIPVTVIGQQKGRNLEENIKYRFGMPNPEGYRKAVRLMKQAEKFKRPVITFIDTPGAYPGIEAEAGGQGEAIAQSIGTMARLKVPTIAVFIGEGGSGGALAIGVADRTIMLENSIFSILSPEGFASILWKDSSRWKEACDVMKFTAEDLYGFDICDVVIPEGDGAHKNRTEVFRNVEREIYKSLKLIVNKKGSQLAEERYRKLRGVGRYHGRD